MVACAIAPNEKRVLTQRVGKRLVSPYGKRRSYAPKLVKAAMRRSDFPDAWDCWALSLFCSPDDFASYHVQTGEACDFTSTHADMLSALGAEIDLSSAHDLLSCDWLGAAAFAADAASS